MFFIENGLCKVEPYNYVQKTFVKGRWIGKTLMEFTAEFANKTYYQQQITIGLLTVNNEKSDLNYVLKNGDLITHSKHFHELPVTSKEIEIILKNDNLLVCSKPGSMPIHPTGKYNLNTLTSKLKMMFDLKELYPIHRIDRLTSGLCLLALDKSTCAEYGLKIKRAEMQKVYLARVVGVFIINLEFPRHDRVLRAFEKIAPRLRNINCFRRR